MITSIAFFLLISSGGVFGASVLKRKYEEMLPLSVFAVILIQYCFGLVGQLRVGAYSVYFIAIAVYGWSAASVIKQKSFREFKGLFVTPGFAVTVIGYVVINFASYQKLAYSWDEFSHWADVVKAMVSLDDYISNPMSMSIFKSYVPAMPLFQYNMQILGQTLMQDYVFCEWHLYVCYQVATYSLLVYFLRDVNCKRIGYILIYGGVAFLLPSAFFSFYNVLVIDAFLAILAGCSLAYMIVMRKKDPIDYTVFILSLSCLVLTKDSGLFIAIFIGSLFALTQLIAFVKTRSVKDHVFRGIFLIASIVIPKWLWSGHLAGKSVSVAFGASINPIQFLKILVQGDKTDYRWVTAQNFWQTLTQSGVSIGDTGLEMNYLLLIVILASVLIVLISLYKRHCDDKTSVPIQIGVALFSTVYVISMCAMYMYKFSVIEAVGLASFQRYMSVLISMLYTATWILVAQLFNIRKAKRAIYVMLAIFALALPFHPAKNYLFGEYVKWALAFRAPYTVGVSNIGYTFTGF